MLENEVPEEGASPDPKNPTADIAVALNNVAALIVPVFEKARGDATEAIREYNQAQVKLWGRAMWLESIFIGIVLVGGFSAVIALAMVSQIASAEKIAFALFGFIGGRGFLNIRGQMDAASKRN